MSTPERISVYNLADLKNTSDDAIQNYLGSLKFRQSHVLTDTRLALGYGAFAIAAACFGWDYYLGFDRTKHLTAAAVVIYTVLNAILTAWVSLRERSVIYEGVSPAGKKISISTTTKKNIPIYDLSIRLAPTGPGQPAVTVALSRPFSGWFNSQGVFVAQPFQELLATSVPEIGRLDPKNLRTDTHKLAETSPELLDAILGQIAAGDTTTTTPVPLSGSATPAETKKARKRK